MYIIVYVFVSKVIRDICLHWKQFKTPFLMFDIFMPWCLYSTSPFICQAKPLEKWVLSDKAWGFHITAPSLGLKQIFSMLYIFFKWILGLMPFADIRLHNLCTQHVHDQFDNTIKETSDKWGINLANFSSSTNGGIGSRDLNYVSKRSNRGNNKWLDHRIGRNSRALSWADTSLYPWVSYSNWKFS